MNELLSVGTIVRVIPGKEHYCSAKLIRGGLYKIYIVDSCQGSTSYCLGKKGESKWATRNMIQPIDLKPGSLVLLGGQVYTVYNIAAGKNYQDGKLCGISVTPLNHLCQIPYWIVDGNLKLYGI